ncbi:MAG: hypothetical protein IPL76_10775 [Gemmatimonadetes bacterium]|nr:hypothetical protein [Gemmatimonadota bacterium]
MFAHFGSSSAGNFTTEGKWAVINLVFVLVAALYFVMNDIPMGDVAEPSKLSMLLMVLCLIRSTVDYIWCSNVYFPE